MVPFVPRRKAVYARRTAEGAEVRCIVDDYTYAKIQENGMACREWCTRCRRNGATCKRADRDKPHRCQEFEPDHEGIE